jgi:hypothetical protein
MKHEFECIGYMKHKMPGEDDFGMFVNENSGTSIGGFKWEFQDNCPDLPHEYGRIFVHLISIDELRRKIRHEIEMQYYCAV